MRLCKVSDVCNYIVHSLKAIETYGQTGEDVEYDKERLGSLRDLIAGKTGDDIVALDDLDYEFLFGEQIGN
jgi:hypothetical protein